MAHAIRNCALKENATTILSQEEEDSFGIDYQLRSTNTDTIGDGDTSISKNLGHDTLEICYFLFF